MRHSPGNLSTAYGLCAILLWSTTFALARSSSEQVGPLTAAAAAYLIGGSVCLLRLGLSDEGFGGFLKLPRPYLFGCGLLFVFYPTAIYLAVGLAKDRQELLEVALVNYLWPSLTILLSLPLLNKRASLHLAPGTGLALVGVLLVMTQGAQISWASFQAHLQDNPVAFALALAGAVAWAFYSNLARRWSGSGSQGAVGLFMPITGLVLLGFRLGTAETTRWSPRAIGEVVALAAVTTLSYGLWDVAMRKGNLLVVVTSSYFTPLLSTLVSCLYLNVAPSPKLWIGCLLLVGGSLLTWRSVSDRTA